VFKGGRIRLRLQASGLRLQALCSCLWLMASNAWLFIRKVSNQATFIF